MDRWIDGSMVGFREEVPVVAFGSGVLLTGASTGVGSRPASPARLPGEATLAHRWEAF
jgi:hypothetical protein